MLHFPKFLVSDKTSGFQPGVRGPPSGPRMILGRPQVVKGPQGGRSTGVY